MTNSQHRIVKNVARWTFHELLPIIILLGLAGLMWVNFAVQIITEVWLAGVLSGLFLGCAVLVIFVSSRRKWKSTLFARLADDKNHHIEVWMRKPLKDKWKGRLDEGSNKGSLATLVGATFEVVQGTPIMTIKLKNGKPVVIPIRLAEHPEMKKYLGAAVAVSKAKLKFENNEDAQEFASLITLPKDLDNLPTPDLDEPMQEEIDTAPAQTKEESVVVSPNRDIAPAKPKKTIKLDYSEYDRPVVRDHSPVLTENEHGKVTVGSIATAIASEVEEEPSEVSEEATNVDALLNLGDSSVTSVDIDLGNFAPTDEGPASETEAKG